VVRHAGKHVVEEVLRLDEEAAVAVLEGLEQECRREPGLAYASLADEDEILALGNEVELGELPNRRLVDARLQVEALSGDGRWVAITDTPEYLKADFPTGIRRAAARDVKALGFRYLLLNDGDEVYKDMNKYAKFWGVTQIAEANGTHFYRID